MTRTTRSSNFSDPDPGAPVECDDSCLPHAPGCDGLCDHSANHRNACMEGGIDTGNAGCDRCGTNDRLQGSKLCAGCTSELPVEFKVTHGYVRQDFVGGKCVAQKFVAGDPVDWETEMGEPIPDPEHFNVYQPFDMLQPQKKLSIRMGGIQNIAPIADILRNADKTMTVELSLAVKVTSERDDEEVSVRQQLEERLDQLQIPYEVTDG